MDREKPHLGETLSQAQGAQTGTRPELAGPYPHGAGTRSSRRNGHEAGARERLLRQGPAALTDAELLAVCLRSGGDGYPVLMLAESLLTTFGGLAGLQRATGAQLQGVKGLGPAKTASLLAARHLGERMAAAEVASGEVLSTSSAVERYLRLALGHHQQEVFACLFLDTRHRLLGFEKLFFGSVDRANVYPREIMKRALTYNAAAVILAHNHPSGVPEPSPSDIRLSEELRKLLAHLDIAVLDHIVVSGTRGVSMAQRGLI